MEGKFDIGDRVICKESGVIGKVLKFYVPTASEEQTMVKTDDGREYHAPTRTWTKSKVGIEPRAIMLDYYAVGFTAAEVSMALSRLQKIGVRSMNGR